MKSPLKTSRSFQLDSRPGSSVKRRRLNKLSNKTDTRKPQMIPASEMEAGIESYPGAISLLPLNCDIHREEFIKYFCRDED